MFATQARARFAPYESTAAAAAAGTARARHPPADRPVRRRRRRLRRRRRHSRQRQRRAEYDCCIFPFRFVFVFIFSNAGTTGGARATRRRLVGTTTGYIYFRRVFLSLVLLSPLLFYRPFSRPIHLCSVDNFFFYIKNIFVGVCGKKSIKYTKFNVKAAMAE